MNITRLNFKEAYPYLLNAISEANFIALDFQMSGIVSNFNLDPSSTDSVHLSYNQIQNRYFKTKCKAERFIPLQLGLCPLKISAGKVIYSPFNIYIYPLSIIEREAQQFSFNSQSMRFLAKNNFDFNKLFYEGLPFLSTKRLKRMQYKIEEVRQRQQQTKQYILQSPGVAAFLNLKLAEVSNWISTQCQPTLESPHTSQSNKKEIFVDIQFIRVRAYESLVYLIKKNYPSLALKFEYLDTNRNPLPEWNFLARKYLKITKIPAQELSSIKQTDITSSPNITNADSTNSDTSNPQTPEAQTKKDKNQTDQKKLKPSEPPLQSLQLNSLWETITKRRIPIIVHNGYLDLMHLYHRFIDDLPNQQKSYRDKIGKEFPLIYDTKYICNNSPVIFNKLGKDTSLGNCYKNLRQLQLNQQKNQGQQSNKKQQNSTESVISQFCGQYKFDDQVSHHQAGYDALMTAYTFVNAMKMLHYPSQKLIQPSFWSTVQYYSNKVPLGNIRLPYNFAQPTLNYESDATKQFYFTCLSKRNSKKSSTSSLLPTSQTFLEKQQKLHNFFTKNYGPVKIIWENRGQMNFTLSFIKAQHEISFLKNLDQFGFALYSIQKSDRYLVSCKHLPEKKIFKAEDQVQKLNE